LDFASLYPTIIQQYNLSHEGFSENHDGDPRFYNHSDGCSFMKSSEGGIAVLPALLLKLAKSRKVFKKVMAFHEKAAFEATTPEDRALHLFQEKVFDAKQKV